MKNIIVFTSCWFIMLMVIFGCGRVRPEAPYATELDSTLTLPLSTLVIPIRYHVDSLENTINEKVKGTFLKQWIEVNENKDSLYLELTKKSRIAIRWQNTTLSYQFPLHIEGRFIKRIGKKFTLRNETPVTMDVVLHMTTQLSFHEDWNLKPDTKLLHIEWTKEPILRVAFININLRKKVDEVLESKKSELTDLVDRELKKILNTREIMEKLWFDIQKPIVINRQSTMVWLKPQAESLTASLVQDGKYLGLDAELKTRIRTVLEGEELPADEKTLPSYKALTNKEDSLELYVLVTAPFKRINESLNEALAGKEIEKEGYKTTVKKVRAYGTDQGLAVAIELRGDVDGTVYVRGVPIYDSLQSALKINNFSFDIDSQNALVQSADWLLHDDALQLIKEKLFVDIQPLVQMLPELIQGGLEKGKTGKKMELFITSLDVVPYTILITKQDVQVILKAKGKAVIGLQKEVFAKKKK